MSNLGVVICAGFFVSLLLGLSVGYILGLERGMKIDKIGSILPSVPLLRSFGRREKHKPKFISEEVQAKRESLSAPRDPE